MVFENRGQTTYNFTLNNAKLDVVEFFKYLGVHLYKNGKWNRTQKSIAQHASRSLHNLFTVYNQLDLPISQKITLFDTLVSPILNYAANVWGYHEAPDVEIIHSKFCRRLMCVKQSTDLDALYGELGRTSVYSHRKLILIKYWIKLLKLDWDTILFRTYNMLKNDADNGLSYNGNNWAHHIKNMLQQIGLTYVWDNQFNNTIKYNNIKLRILDIFQQNWISSISNSNRLSTYSSFKNTLHFETYLDVIKEPKFRIALTRFRVSSHDLDIERGRYTYIHRNNRTCKQCQLNQKETEYHFLLICPKYSDIRSKYIKRIYYTWPTKL